jgi:hypothetical protein
LPLPPAAPATVTPLATFTVVFGTEVPLLPVFCEIKFPKLDAPAPAEAVNPTTTLYCCPAVTA